ncbi:toll/interleukin-1 receptor domain-containing protein [Corallococcus exercitus]|uniref:Toll/interleukin-1 receptor domain-containing protein n=1 Tax=Corallococcus exercitus TaxID=2316736 RepID=A0A7Y4KE53_9BACT|nr:toll/interleukin-1 receptor domain-containing protein [Corallococcus exercitus]NOK32026.1 toll/interleukin-1 receptor domain-containing protein [Corallococcus exercitus]
MKDFFISYTGTDKAWAEWMAWALEEAGFSVEFQAWDFRPGSNFVLKMHQAVQQCQRILLVLTEAFARSDFASTEWAAVFADDPAGLQHKVVPVRVEPCSPSGLLKAITFIDLVGIDEGEARQGLLDGLNVQRAKPATPPPFPGRASPRNVSSHPSFPGTARQQASASAPYLPRLPRKTTDLEVQRFTKDSFGIIQRRFTQWLEDLRQSDARFETEFQKVDETKFISQVYVDGELRCQAKIWLTRDLGRKPQVAYYADRGLNISQDSTYNDVLAAEDSPEGLHLKALMHVGAMRPTGGRPLNPSRMTAEESAEYLWQCFLGSLGG